MIDSKPPYPWLPLQIIVGLRPRSSPCNSCMDFSLRPSPTRFSRPQGHADPESIILSVGALESRAPGAGARSAALGRGPALGQPLGRRAPCSGALDPDDDLRVVVAVADVFAGPPEDLEAIDETARAHGP